MVDFHRRGCRWAPRPEPTAFPWCRYFLERSMTVADDIALNVAPDEAASLRRIVWSSVIGTAVEWYDFLIYGTATARVFNKVFFAAASPTLSIIAAFGTYSGDT